MRKSARYTCLAVPVALCGIMALNVVQTKTTNNTGEVLSGFDAIHYRQDSAAAHEGTLTDERISQELESYYNVTFEKIDPEELAQMSGSAAYDTITRLYDEQTVQFIYDDYFSWLIRPGRRIREWSPRRFSAFIGAHPDTTLEEALASLAQRTLDANMQGAWTYSDSERAFWTAKQAEVTHPLSYGYAGGWSNVIDCIAFVSFAILAVCVALAPRVRRRVRGPHRQRAPLLPLRKDASAHGEDPGIASVRGSATSPCALSPSAACRLPPTAPAGRTCRFRCSRWDRPTISPSPKRL